jgi:hypothetical protein
LKLEEVRGYTVRSVLARLFQGLAWLILAGLVAQFYLAGAALFGATPFRPHRTLGSVLVVAALLLLVLALVARPGRRVVGLTAGLVGLIIVEVLLPSLRIGWPWVAAFHIVVAVAIAAQAAAIACILSRAPAGVRLLDV